jgi:hypothetical protein
MCPACIGTAAMIYASVTSAGGLTALVIKKRRSAAGNKDVIAPAVNAGERERAPPPSTVS